jgi:uncharacterized C2H2 Zn-finger protein
MASVTQNNDEKKVLDFLQLHPFLRDTKANVFAQIAVETKINNHKIEEIIISLQRKKCVNLSRGTIYNPLTNNSTDYFELGISRNLTKPPSQLLRSIQTNKTTNDFKKQEFKCPTCSNIYSKEANFDEHIKKHEQEKKQSEQSEKHRRYMEELRKTLDARPKSTSIVVKSTTKVVNYLRCPQCRIKIKASRLSKHMVKAHGEKQKNNLTSTINKPKENFRPSPIMPEFNSDLLKLELLDFLINKNYDVEAFQDYIVARNKDWLKDTYLIKIGNSNAYLQYSNLTNIIMTLSKFQNYINTLGRFGHEKIDFTSFRKDVITPFGWHAWLPDNVRHSALDYSLIHFPEHRILHLLLWMKNAWPKNPNLDQYGEIVIGDYRWFERERVSTAYHIAKRNLIFKLEDEFAKVGVPNNFERFFSGFHEIGHWFVIIG